MMYGEGQQVNLVHCQRNSTRRAHAEPNSRGCCGSQGSPTATRRVPGRVLDCRSTLVTRIASKMLFSYAQLRQPRPRRMLSTRCRFTATVAPPQRQRRTRRNAGLASPNGRSLGHKVGAVGSRDKPEGQSGHSATDHSQRNVDLCRVRESLG